MTIMLVFWCVVRIAYITTVMHFVHDIQYIYWAYPITWSLSSIVYLIYYHFSDWVHGFEKKAEKLQPEEAKIAGRHFQCLPVSYTLYVLI